MIDTIRIFSYFNDEREERETDQFLKDNFVFQNNIEQISDESIPVKEFIQCKMKNLSIRKNSSKITIEGSIWKYYKERNDGIFTLTEVNDAFNQLKFSIPTIDWDNARFSKLHYGPNIILNESPDLYSTLIEGYKGKKVSIIKDKSYTISVGSESNQLIFYNKTIESPENIKENVLRIEHKVHSSYWREKYFESPYPTINYLLGNTRKLPDIWYNFYSDTNKNYNPKLMTIKSISDLYLILISSFGYEKIEKIAKYSLQSSELKKTKFEYIKRAIDKYRKKGENMANSSNRLFELDQKAKDIVNFYKNS